MLREWTIQHPGYTFWIIVLIIFLIQDIVERICNVINRNKMIKSKESKDDE